MSTNDLLQKLRKLLAESADTTEYRQSWQELFGQEVSISSRSIRAAEAVRGFAGSWAASYSMQEGHDPINSGDVTPKSGFDYQLGKRGYPEINFVPYDWNTNRFGKKGPSLVGHPVSFEVVGATEKTLGRQDWEFAVDLSKNTITVPSASIGILYGNLDVNIPTWVVVTDCGGSGDSPDLPMTCLHGLKETPKHNGTARYEMFRIEEADPSTKTIVLAPSKRLGEYFYEFDTTDGSVAQPAIKSLMVIQPKVARLAPIQDSDGKTFVFLPPERAAVGEYQKAHQSWINLNGLDADYNNGSLTPIPKPIPLHGHANSTAEATSEHGEFTAQFNSVDEPLGDSSFGRFRVHIGEANVEEVVERNLIHGSGLLLHISEIYHYDSSSHDTHDHRYGNLNGYFEIVDHGTTGDNRYWVECRLHAATVDPSSGLPIWGDSSSNGIIFDETVRAKCTLHKPVTSLFNTNTDIAANRRRRTYADNLEAARLTGLIDPKEVGRSGKVHGTNDVPVGGYAGRADRAIPNTQLGLDPGSLLDLGFRAVFFTGDEGVIDWEKPIASNEVVLDPNKTDERQYIDVDYASGILKFSHTPKFGGDFNIGKDKNAIVYAAFVPYSMEGGQRSVGVRLTGGDLHSANMGYPNAIQRDVFSKEMLFAVSGTQEIQWGDPLVLKYEGPIPPQIPESGYFTIAHNKLGKPSGSIPYLDTHEGRETYSYNNYAVTADNTIILEGVRGESLVDTPDTLYATQGVFIRHRPDLKSLYDWSYGSSARTDSIRFAYGDITYNEDGSMTVMPTAVAGPAEELRAFFPLGYVGDKTTEIGRFHLEKDTQRWTTDDPTWYTSGHKQPPSQTNEIGIEVSRGRLYTNWKFQPKTNISVKQVMGLISDFDIDNLKSELVAMPDSFTVLIPDNEEKQINVSLLDEEVFSLLSLRIEGATLRGQGLGVLKDASMVAVPEDSRFIFGVTPLERSSTRDPIISEACLNVSVYQAQSGDSLQEVIDATPGSELGRLASGDAHFALTGRQAFAFPANPYLASREFTFPFAFDHELRAVVDLRTCHVAYLQGKDFSEEAMKQPRAWTHFEMVVENDNPGVDTILNDANELAKHLNEQSLYRASTINALANANFCGSGTVNPDLAVLGFQEHALAWIGPNDLRFPSSLSQNQVCLIYTGSGHQLRNGLAYATNKLGGVICEIDYANKDLKGVDSLLTFMGQDFARESNPKKPQPRFGGVQVTRGDYAAPIRRATGNLDSLGFSQRGTRPLGRYVGSFEISRGSYSDGITSIEARFPTGANSHWYNDQSSSSSAANLSGRDATANSGWLGRLSWPLHHPAIEDQSLIGQVAGLFDVYATFGVDQFNESWDTNNPLHRPLFNNPSYVLEVDLGSSGAKDEWSAPNNIWSSMAIGDLVSFISGEFIGEGRLLTKTDEPSKFTVLGSSVETNSTPDGSTWSDKPLIKTPFGNNQSGIHPVSIYGIGAGANSYVRITPSTVSGLQSAVAHFVHAAGHTQDSEFLEGFASGGVPSSVLIGSGRVSMMSVSGVEPTGIALHNLISPPVGKGTSSETRSYNKSSTFIESGAFTTYIGGGDSRGFWQSLEDLPELGGITTPPKKVAGYPSPISRESLDIGGVGGVRISGDAYLWLDKVQQLVSDAPNAVLVDQNTSIVSGLVDAPSGHLVRNLSTLVPGEGMVVQEATIEIGLTQADLSALKGFSSQSDYILQTGRRPWMDNSNSIDLGLRLFQFGQMAVATHKPLLMPSLVGNYIALTNYSQHNIRPATQRSANSNQGVWRIVGTPMVVDNAAIKYLDLGLKGTPHNALTTDAGRQKEAQVVAIMAVRVEGFRILNEDEFQYEGTGKHWGIYRDALAETPIFTGDVVDPGGNPTGAPASLRGLTLDPQVIAGKSSFSAELIPLDATDLGDRLPLTDFIPEKFNKSGVELLGVHDQIGRFGKHFSRAFFAAKVNVNQEITKPFKARMVVHANDGGLLDGFSRYNPQGKINIDGKAGQFDLGYPKRLGPGVIMDGGLGLVQANAFRARPRPTQVEHLGKLMVWGRGAYPLQNSVRTGNIGAELPSVFNTSEFYGEVSIANPQSRLVFESPQAAEGVVANMLAAEFLSARHRGPSHFTHYVARAEISSSIKSVEYSEDISQPENIILRNTVVSDTLFPHISSGSVFRTPGTTVYERAFRSLDATGSNPYRKSNDGTHNRSGITGLGIPVEGEVLLLPQGPTDKGHSTHKLGVGWDEVYGKTPLDNPLYEFVNGPPINQLVAGNAVPLTRFSVSPFGINVADVIYSVGNASYVDIDRGVDNHFGQMGTVSQAYRHSNSREDGAVFPKNTAVRQIRVLDGMVLEDITNGTFYTIGSVGREFYMGGASASLGVPGDGRRSPVNGSLAVAGFQKFQTTEPNSGSTYEKYSLPELIYDIGSSFSPEPSQNVLDTIENGFGDRSDQYKVRRPLTGHKFRVTPNVEFVPVLGYRGVDGGLIPTKLYGINNNGEFYPRGYEVPSEADAFFYDLRYTFKEDDIGKMIYICGTEEYAFTGWWVILDTITPQTGGSESYLFAHPEEAAFISSAAVLRKFNWGARGEGGPLPIQSGLKPIAFTSTADQMTNCIDGRGHLQVNGLTPDHDDLYIHITDSRGDEHEKYILKADLAFTDVAGAVTFLNNDPRSNGQEILWDYEGQVGVPADYPKFIRWSYRADAIHCEMWHTWSEREWLFSGGQTTFQVFWKTRTDGVHDVHNGESLVGFGYCEGHNLAAAREVGDRNNAIPVKFTNIPAKFEGYRKVPAGGLRWVFSHPLTEENVGSYLHLTKPPIYRFSTVLPSQQSVNSLSYAYDAKWTSGNAQQSDIFKAVDLNTDIYKINRCPTTARMVLGGDCEVFHPEFGQVWPEATNGESVKLPIMYSPLGVHGVWQDSVTGQVDKDKFNCPVTYALQPIAREKVVTVSPSSAKSSVLFARGLSDLSGTPQGPQGVGPAVVSGSSATMSPTASFAMEPWQLVSRSDMTRTTMFQPSDWNFDGRVELNNADLNLVEAGNLLNSATARLIENITQIKVTSSDIATLNSELTALNAYAAKLNASLIAAASTISTLQAVVLKTEATGQGQLALAKEAELISAEESYKSLQQWRKETESEYATLGQKITELSAKEADGLAVKDELSDALVLEQDQLALEITELATVSKSLAQTEADIQDAQVSLGDCQTEIDSLTIVLQGIDENLDWEAEYEGNDAAVAKAVVAIRKVSEEKVTLMRTVYSLSVQLQNFKRQEEIAQTVVEKREMVIDEISAQLKKMVAYLDAVSDELEDLTDAWSGDYSPALVTKLEAINWLTIVPSQIGLWANTYSTKTLIEVLKTWDTTEAPVTIKVLAGEYDALLIAAGLDVAYADVENAFATLEALIGEATTTALSKIENKNNMLFEVKKLNYLTASNAHLQEIENYWADVIQVNPLGSALEVAAQSSYVWTPAGEWWQLYQPAWDQYGPDASASPPTLKIDLTDSFTQAIGPGSGLNTPHVNRFPRGVRLNRIYVNFGVWGTENDNGRNRMGFNTPGFPPELELGNQEMNIVLNQMYMSFNLILEIPATKSSNMVAGKQTYSGNEAFPFGGRMPTAATNHENNDETVFSGGTIVVPLYVNREAGDMMPNVMERFVTVGPKPDHTWRYSDWSGGDYETGFGCTSEDSNDPSMFARDVDLLNAYGLSNIELSKGLWSNAFNPVVWGGMDFAPYASTSDGGVFDEARFARVQASIFPRSSTVGGGLRSSFTSGLVPDGSAFSKYDPHSLSGATLTGITIAHSGQMPEAPLASDGSYSAYNRRGGHTCPHGFTLALTPVGDIHDTHSKRNLNPHQFAPNLEPSIGTAHYGRKLNNPFDLVKPDNINKPFKVGNWLENIAKAYGIYTPSGSMLPPGSRVYLEVACGPGPAAKDQDPLGKIGAGAWLGSVKLSFDVETVDGTAWTQDVNILGDEEG